VNTKLTIPPAQFTYVAKKAMPTEQTDSLSERAISTWIAIISHSANESDRANWLKLAMRDHYVTVAQVKRIYHTLEDIYKKSDDMKLNIGRLNGKDILMATWSRVLDSANKYSLLKYMLPSDEEMLFLAKTLGFMKFSFNLVNPTGHWHLKLNKGER